MTLGRLAVGVVKLLEASLSTHRQGQPCWQGQDLQKWQCQTTLLHHHQLKPVFPGEDEVGEEGDREPPPKVKSFSLADDESNYSLFSFQEASECHKPWYWQE